MSCSSPPLEEHRHPDDDGRKTRAAPALELLDEYWFFSNTLAATNNNSAKKKTTTPPQLPRSPSSTSTGTGEMKASSGSRLGGRRLLRTPSLPSSRVGMTTESPLPLPLPLPSNKEHQGGASGAAASASGNQQQPQQQRVAAVEEHEIDDDDLNWSSIYQGVLRTRMAEGGDRSRSSALRRAPSMPVVPSPGDGDGRQSRSTPSRMLRHSHSTLGRHTITTNTKQAEAEQRTPAAGGQPRREVRSSSLRLSASQQQQQASKKQTTSGLQLEDKKWKSSSDLESIEVQGFRDLGFVFDREELRESLADVLPGLKQQQTQQQQTKSQSQSISSSPRRERPYLSEAWQPALARVQSAAEMKDQLRMWAQAVACNVRQDVS